MADLTAEKWVVIDSGGRVMLKAVGEPQIICSLETIPLKRTPRVCARAALIAAAPELLAACENIEANLSGSDCFAERVKDSIRRARDAIAKATATNH